MGYITNGKVIVGSTLKALNKAKVYGVLDLTNIYMYNVIYELLNTCELGICFKDVTTLKRLLKELQYTKDDICIYKKQEKNNIFINGAKDISFNSVINTQNTEDIIETDNFVMITDKEIEVFSVEDFTINLSLEPSESYVLKVTSLPLHGLLVLNNAPITQGQLIAFSDIENSLFKFIPNDIDANYTVNFNFQIIKL